MRARAGRAWRARIGVVLQESEPEAELTVEECLALCAGYYPAPQPVAETLELVGLADRRNARCGRSQVRAVVRVRFISGLPPWASPGPAPC